MTEFLAQWIQALWAILCQSGPYLLVGFFLAGLIKVCVPEEKIFRLLQPERIGCVLTENWQIDPEQSTSAFVVHHVEARYFNP